MLSLHHLLSQNNTKKCVTSRGHHGVSGILRVATTCVLLKTSIPRFVFLSFYTGPKSPSLFGPPFDVKLMCVSERSTSHIFDFFADDDDEREGAPARCCCCLLLLPCLAAAAAVVAVLVRGGVARRDDADV